MSSYSSTYPAIRPTYQIDFSNGGRIPPNATFSRSDSPIDATKAAASAVHFWSNEKHISSENLIINSDASDWYFDSSNFTTTASQTGPDGGSNATQFTEKANGSQQYKIQSGNFTPIANQEITYSVWLKQTSGSRDYQQIRVGNIGGGRAWATFNLTNGTVDQVNGNLGVTASVNAGPTGWYQCVMRFTPDSTTALSFYIYAAAASGGELPSVTGDTGNSYSLFGAQVSTIGQTTTIETSGSIHRQYASTLKSVSTAGQPRFEYGIDGQSAGTSLGILVEGQSTNLVTRSSEIDHSYWSKGALDIDANAAISVDGTLTADLLRPTTASGTHYALAPVTTTASSTYTASAYVKAAGYSKIQLYFYQSTSPYTTEASSVFTLSGSGSATAAVGSSTITAVGGGYYRISVTGVAGSSGSNIQIRPVNDAGTDNFAGDGYSGIICTGVQFELGSHASSFIGTSGSTATRAADSLSVATADIPGFSEGVGTIVCETGGVASATDGNQLAFGLNGPASSNQFSAGVNAGGLADSTVRVYSQTPAGDQAFLNPGTATVGTGYKLACRYELDNIAASMNGGTVVSDTSGQVPVGIDTLWIGELEGNYHINSNIKRIAIYGEALSDTNLISLTS